MQHFWDFLGPPDTNGLFSKTGLHQFSHLQISSCEKNKKTDAPNLRLCIANQQMDRRMNHIKMEFIEKFLKPIFSEKSLKHI